MLVSISISFGPISLTTSRQMVVGFGQEVVVAWMPLIRRFRPEPIYGSATGISHRESRRKHTRIIFRDRI
jgi:hypothetical protein